jgi:predicted RNA binding protein YcfA (HicA-like mRNA interferase family)
VSGSHYILRHPGRAGLRVTIAWHRKDLKPKTLRAIIKQAGLTEAEFLRLL